jgi:NADH:ubiquinone oxidoreductase subunit C
LLDQENGIIVFQAPVKKISQITKKLKEYEYCVFLDNGDFDYVGRELNGRKIVLVEFQTKKIDEGYPAIVVDKTFVDLTKHYATIDNGGKSFYVTISVDKSRKIDVKVRHYNSKFETTFENVNKVFIGDDSFDPGNSILINLGGNQYVFVGDNLYSFTAPEEITEYYSEVGNSSVPYPVAGSKNYIYFMLSDDLVYVPRTEFSKNVNLFSQAYGQYYGHTYVFT